MARGRAAARPGAKRGRGRARGTAASAAAVEEDPTAWMRGVDLEADEPVSIDTMRRVYQLDRRCVRTVGVHKGKLCDESPDCLVGLFSRPSKPSLVSASIGRSRPEAVRTRDVQTEGAGLRNCGNTCYLNSVFQMLARCPAFLRLVIGGDADADGAAKMDNFHIPAVFAALVASQRAVVDPRPMVDALGLEVSVQQDAQEYLALFFSLLGDCSKTINDGLSQAFGGQVLATRVCGSCGASTKKAEGFMFVSVAASAAGADVVQCIRDRYQPESIEASCEGCGKKGITMTTTTEIKRCPPYLVVHLFRFEYDAVKQRRVKTQHGVRINRTFPASVLTGNESDKRWYRVRGVVDHHGHSPTGGHYTGSFVPLNGADAASDADGGVGPNKWHLHNDDVTKDVTPFGDKDPMAFTSKDAYMVLYELVDEPQGPVGGTAVYPDELRPALAASVAEADRNSAAAAQAYKELESAREQEVEAWYDLCEDIFANGLSNSSRGKAAPVEHTEQASLLAFAAEERYFVAEAWLKEFAAGRFIGEDSAAARRVKNMDLVCCHGPFVDPSQHYRVIAKEHWAQLKKFQGADQPLPTATAVCSKCCRRVIEDKQRGDAVLDAWRQLQSQVRAGATEHNVVVDVADSDDENEAGSESGSEEQADVDTGDLNRFIAISVYEAILEMDAPPAADEAALNDLTASLVCSHGNISPDGAKKVVSADTFDQLLAYGFACATPFSAPLDPNDYGHSVCQTCVTERVSSAHKINDVKQRKFAVLKDVHCLTHHDNNRAIFGRDIANYTKTHRKKWQQAQDKDREDAEAAKAEAERLAAEKAKEEAAANANRLKVNFRKNSKSASPAAASPSPSPAAHADPNADTVVSADVSPSSAQPAEPTCPDRRVEHFIVPLTWVNQLRAWIEDQTHEAVDAPPAVIPLSDFVCRHQLSAIGVNDVHPSRRRDGPIAVVIKEAEFEALAKHFVVNRDAAFKLVEVNDVRVIEPRECPGCIEDRRDAELHSARFFTAGTIKVVGKFKKNKKHRLVVDLDIPDVAHDTTLAAFAATVTSHIMENHSVFVPADEISFVFDKIAIADPAATTFSEAKIMDGDTVTIEVGDEVVMNAKQATKEASQWQEIPAELLNASASPAQEQAFGGTALAGAGANASSPAAGVIACPLCTFDNPSIRTICEICESPLPKQ